jgi:hypothetical protein
MKILVLEPYSGGWHKTLCLAPYAFYLTPCALCLTPYALCHAPYYNHFYVVALFILLP